MRLSVLLIVAAVALLQPDFADADLPVHCVHSQVRGTWTFHRGAGEKEKMGLKCSQTPEVYDHASDRYGLGEPNFQVADKIKVHLKEPNIAEHVDAQGKHHKGTWTMIYDEGFEVTINKHKYFAFSYFKQGSTEHHKKSVCHMSFPGWYHNANNPDSKSWGCYYATKENKQEGDETEHLIETEEGEEEKAQKLYTPEHDLVAHINRKASTWKAKVYPEFASKQMHELHSMGGGKVYHTDKQYRAPTHDQLLQEVESKGEGDVYDISNLPKVMDWRNKDGQNYVGPVINQGACGSCYAVAVTDMINSRVRIRTKNRKQGALSVQKVLSCSEYSQGCKGGFPFLVAKYAQDFGMSQLSDSRYVGKRGVQCPKKTHIKARTTSYGYVGGYYGACNYKKMMHEIHKNGPIVVGFNTEAGLWHYDSGVYEEESSMSFIESAEGEAKKQAWGGPWIGKRMHNHWQKTTHAVLVVGWGENRDQGKYWIVKNSWGPNWGEKGYFRTKRGVDSVAMESMAVHAEPVPGNNEYFESQAKMLGEELDESLFEPVPKIGEDNDDSAENSSNDAQDDGGKLDSAPHMSAVEKASRAGAMSDDIMGTNEVGDVDIGFDSD
jgi:cathepsin C